MSTEGPLRRDLKNPAADESPHPSASPVDPGAAFEPPVDEIEHPAASARIPGDTRRPLTRFPTDQIEVLPVYESGPALDEPTLAELVPAAPPRGIFAPFALALAIIALCVSFFVGWGIPIALLAVGFSVAALRRPVESRAVAHWALVLGLLATVYSLGWLIWAALVLEQTAA